MTQCHGFRSTRRAGLAAVSFLVAVGAVASAAEPSGGQGKLGTGATVTKTLQSTCPMAGVGSIELAVEVTATFPASVVAGQPALVEDISATFAVPERSVAILTAAGATSVAGSAVARLTATAPDGETTKRIGTIVPATVLPPAGDFRLTARRAEDRIPTTATGVVRFRIDTPELSLAVPSAEPGQLAAPVPCTVAGDAPDLAMATVIVRAAQPPATENEHRSPAETSQPVVPGTTTAPRSPRAPALPPKPDCSQGPPKDAQEIKMTLSLTASSWIRHLGTSLEFRHGTVSIDARLWSLNPGEHDNAQHCLVLKADLSLPPASGTFTLLRFARTTAAVGVIPAGPVEAAVDTSGSLSGTAKVSLRLSDVTIGGIALEVGGTCGSAVPVELKLASNPGEWNIFDGGTIETDFTVPAFRGCRTPDESFDPLLDHLVSGDGNRLVLCFGPIDGTAPRACGRAAGGSR